jgi:hypothetical protein
VNVHLTHDVGSQWACPECGTLCPLCQYRLKITHSAGRKRYHPPEKIVYSFSRLVENETGW